MPEFRGTYLLYREGELIGGIIRDKGEGGGIVVTKVILFMN